jgi:hypothetical protein
MTGFIIVTVAVVAVVAASPFVLIGIDRFLERRYGVPVVPEEVLRLDAAFSAGAARGPASRHGAGEPVRLSLDGYAVREELNGHVVFQRSVTTRDGLWDLAVECKGEVPIAYQARFRHHRSFWMNFTREKFLERTRILSSDAGV